MQSTRRSSIWRECAGGDYILYTPDSKVARIIKTWRAFNEGVIREMGHYFADGKMRRAIAGSPHHRALRQPTPQ